MRTMHIFAGIGGGLLADLILGHTPIIAVEWDKYACQVLRERAAEGWFPDLSVWEGDVRLFDPSEYAGKVDCIHAGFPCQDISVAGNQAGVGHETRSGLYREVLRIAGIVRPRYLFLENVAAILGNGLATVLADLAALGFDAEWGCVRASDCGALHNRDRWWLVAKRVNEWKRVVFLGDCEETEDGDFICSECGDEFGECGCPGPTMDEYEYIEKDGVMFARSIVPDSENFGCRDSITSKNEKNKRRRKLAQVSTARGAPFSAERFIEQVRAAEFIRKPNDVSNWVDRIKGLGNAQVPIQAAVAWKLLGGE